MAATIQEISQFLENELNVKDYEQIDKAINGFQVEKRGKIQKICLAVDFCLETLQQAISQKADAILVHHGIYWGKPLPIAGRHYDLIEKLIKHNIALLALHLPLDMHKRWGNNIGLIEELGFYYSHCFGNYHGLKLLFMAEMEKGSKTVGELLKDYRQKFGNPLFVVGEEDRAINKLAVCSGGGLFGLEDAKKEGADAFLVGDANHTMYHLAKELDIVVISGGHYATETIGVKRLGAHMAELFSLETIFLDVPTGL